MNPILRILLVIVLAVAAHFIVKTIRRFSQYLLTMKVDSNETSRRDPDSEISQAIQAIGKGMYNQRRSIILAIPEIFGIKDVKDGQWRYVRIKFKLWPGQINIIEETFKQRVVQLLTKSYADYASWMITVTYKVE